MKKLLVAKSGARFEDPTDEAISRVDFGIAWANDSRLWPEKDVIISPYPWTITGDDSDSHLLRDNRGEVRRIEWGVYCSAIEFPDWKAYDVSLIRAQVSGLKGRLTSLLDENARLRERERASKALMSEIFDINVVGGPGSRAKVRDLLIAAGISPCTECGRVDCVCAEER